MKLDGTRCRGRRTMKIRQRLDTAPRVAVVAVVVAVALVAVAVVAVVVVVVVGGGLQSPRKSPS